MSRHIRVCSGRANILQRTCEHLAAGVRTLCSGRCKTSSLFFPSPPPDNNLGKECLNLSNCKDTTLTLLFASFWPSIFICIQKSGKDCLWHCLTTPQTYSRQAFGKPKVLARVCLGYAKGMPKVCLGLAKRGKSATVLRGASPHSRRRNELLTSRCARAGSRTSETICRTRSSSTKGVGFMSRCDPKRVK